MKKLCKLTTQNNLTLNNTLWGEGITHQTNGSILKKLCTNSWIHYYNSPYLAVLLNSIHGDFVNPKLWEVKVSGFIKSDRDLKFGATKVTTVKEILLPVISIEQKIAIAILCTLHVYKDKEYREWAKKWLSGECKSNPSNRIIFKLKENIKQNFNPTNYKKENRYLAAKWCCSSFMYLENYYKGEIDYCVANAIGYSVTYASIFFKKPLNLFNIIKKGMDIKSRRTLP